MQRKREDAKAIKNIRKTLTNTSDYFKQYCAATSIHGFQYFGEDRTCFEKVWWIFIFFICLTGCSIMIYKIYEKYETSPVIVSFATKETPLYKIPFPAVTICPEVKTDINKFNLTDVFKRKMENKGLNDTENDNLHYMSLLCDNFQKLYDIFENNTLNETFNNDFQDTLDEIKPTFFPLMCEFMGSEAEWCEDFFTPIFTDEGICYSFNILDRGHIFNDGVYHFKDYHKIEDDNRSWNMEQGYFDDSTLFVYPQRALFAGANNGFTVYLATPHEDLDFMCKQFQGFKVVLHSPVRMPRLKQDYFRVPLDQAVIAAVQPTMIATSQAIKKIDVEKRSCYFPTERSLKYFRTYSQQNCQLECQTNITLKKCNCVSIFMPRENGTHMCGIAKSKCMKQAEAAMYLGELYNTFDDSEEISLDNCDCLPLCTDLSYYVESSQSQWDWKESVKLTLDPELLNMTSVHLSSLTIYFRFNHFISAERHELYGPTDFVANFGGLLGLFTGFSILSLIEILYFLTLRVCCNVRLYRNWTGPTS